MLFLVEAVGSSGVQLYEEGEDHVGDFGFVLAERCRGVGVGEVAMKTVLEVAKNRLGVEVVVLGVYESNEVAKNFYRELGFVKVGEIVGGVFLDGEYEDVLIFEENLS